MISVEHLVKRYASKVAVDDVSFEVGKGEVVGFLGPNGAGKSTTLRIIAGFLGATGGSVKVAGHDIATDGFAARQKLGYMPEAVPLYPEMRVVEYLAFRAELKQVARGARRKAVADAMEKANVGDVANVVIGHLSKGYRQRVGLADALVASPPLLVLDEPTAGLDPNQIRDVRDVIRELGREHTVFLSTHILSEVEASCSRVIVIARGKLVAEGTLSDLASKRRPIGLSLTVRGNLDTALAAARSGAVANVTHTESDSDGVFSIRCAWNGAVDEAEAQRVAETTVAALVQKGVFVREASPIKSSLEELFSELTAPHEASEAGEANE
jgi:ABC-2 type transport system ATP-binding protein